jgi:hypothetical protein
MFAGTLRLFMTRRSSAAVAFRPDTMSVMNPLASASAAPIQVSFAIISASAAALSDDTHRYVATMAVPMRASVSAPSRKSSSQPYAKVVGRCTISSALSAIWMVSPAHETIVAALAHSPSIITTFSARC